VGSVKSVTLDEFEEQAAVLLQAYDSGTPDAMERLYRQTWHRRPWTAMRAYVQLDLGRRPAGPDDDVAITLDDARYLIAREHGFDDWQALAAFVDRPPERPLPGPISLVSPTADGEWRTLRRSHDLDEILSRLSRHERVGVSGGGWATDEIVRELAGVETLVALDLSGCEGVTDDGVLEIARLPALEHLDLSGTGVTDRGLLILRELPELRHLSLAWTRVTDEGLDALSPCARLEHIDLMGTGAGRGALLAIAGKPTLSHLAIALGDADIPLLRDMPRFARWQGERRPSPPTSVFRVAGTPTHLTLRGRITDAGMRRLQTLEGLASLDVDDGQLAISAAGIEALAALPHLRELRADAKDDWMPAIARLPNLRFLGVQDTSASDEGFVALSRSSSLEYLWGRRCHGLQRTGFKALATMPSLRGLSVSCLNVDDEGLSALPSFPSLVELMPMDVPDEGYRHIGACRQLESLILMYCRDTTDRATEHIASLPALTSYFNSYTAVTDRTPQLLSRMDTLERVTFDTCHGLTNAGVAALASLPRLRELRVSGRQLTADVLRAFDDAVDVGLET
jgi:hypothetical protein